MRGDLTQLPLHITSNLNGDKKKIYNIPKTYIEASELSDTKLEQVALYLSNDYLDSTINCSNYLYLPPNKSYKITYTTYSNYPNDPMQKIYYTDYYTTDNNKTTLYFEDFNTSLQITLPSINNTSKSATIKLNRMHWGALVINKVEFYTIDKSKISPQKKNLNLIKEAKYDLNLTLVDNTYGYERVIKANNLWVACPSGDNKIMYSEDGITWAKSAMYASINGNAHTEIEEGSNSMYGTRDKILHHNGVWYVNIDWGYAQSKTGKSWFDVYSKNFYGSGTVQDYAQVPVYYKNKWVVFSDNDDTDDGKKYYKVYLNTSSDLISWSSTVWASGSGSYLPSTIVKGNDVLLATYSGSYLRSTDGTTWTKYSTPLSYIQFVKDAWFAYNSTTKTCVKSTDGITWTDTSNSHVPFFYSDGVYLSCNVVGSTYYIYYSTDLKFWTQTNLPATSASSCLDTGDNYPRISYTNGLWLTCIGGKLSYSLNGKEWISTNDTIPISDIYYDGTTLIAASSTGLYYCNIPKLPYKNYEEV